MINLAYMEYKSSMGYTNDQIISKMLSLIDQTISKLRKIREFLLNAIGNLKLADNKYHFIWTNHHIILDGWCLPILMG